MKFYVYANTSLLVVLLYGSHADAKKGKKGHSSSSRSRLHATSRQNGSMFKGKSKATGKREPRSFVAFPTYTPELAAATQPPATEAPTFAFAIASQIPSTEAPSFVPSTAAPSFAPVMNAVTSRPKFNFPGTTAQYEFSTTQILNTATKSPHKDCEPTTVPTAVPIINAGTTSPRPTASPTASPTATHPRPSYYYDFSTAFTPTASAQTGSPTESPTGSPTASTEAPTLILTNTPTGIPTQVTATMNAQTLSPVESARIPAASSQSAAPTESPTCIHTGASTDIPTQAIPIMNAGTAAPTESSSIPAATSQSAVPTETPTYIQTDTQTEMPTQVNPNTNGQTAIPIGAVVNVQTYSPIIPNMTVPADFQTEAPTLEPGLTPDAETTNNTTSTSNTETTNNTTSTSNTTARCQSDSGSFFLFEKEKENATTQFDVLTFLYEVETFPRVSAEQVLPSLETAFVDSILSVLFPFRCGEPSSLTSVQERQYQAITGVSSEPVDVVTGAECASKINEKNECAIVNGKMSIFFQGSGLEITTIREIKEALIESMSQGEFDDAQEGIVRVSFTYNEIEDEGTQDEEADSINDNDTSNIYTPTADGGSFLGIGLSLTAASLFLIVAGGASVYRRKKAERENEANTLQESGTLNGLSRFDLTSHDAQSMDDSYTGAARELKIMPLSPAASRSIVGNRYTASQRD